MDTTQKRFSEFAFCAQPGFDEVAFRPAFSNAVNLHTIVIHCFDPRASEIPAVVARHFPGEVYPGENVID